MTDRSDKAGGGGLLPCPFCGGEPVARTAIGGCYIRCVSCLAEVYATNDLVIARKKWNTRASPPSGNAGEAEQMVREGRAITVIIPTGYDSVWDFLHDCGLEAVYPAAPPQPAPDVPHCKRTNYPEGCDWPACTSKCEWIIQPAPDALQRILCGIVGTPDANGMVTFKVHESVVRQMQAVGQPAPDDGPCFYCGEHTNGLAGDPGLWPLQFCQPDGTGINRFHHVKCVTGRLTQPAPDALRTALLNHLDIFLHPNPKVDLSGLTCKHGYAIEACASRECSNPLAYETVIRRARDYIGALSTPLPSGEPPSDPNAESRKVGESFGQAVTDAAIGRG